MQVLTAAMCGAAILAFGVARAGDRPGESASPPAGYVIVKPDAHITSIRAVHGLDRISPTHVLVRTGARDLYLAEVSGPCARDAERERTIAIECGGPSSVDRFSTILIGGRRCAIQSLAEVERAPVT